MSKPNYRIVLHSEAAREILKLPAKLKERVREVIGSLASRPFRPDSAKLHGRSQCYRIRFGEYRLIYEVHATEIVVYVIGIAHRKEVYLRLLRRK